MRKIILSFLILNFYVIAKADDVLSQINFKVEKYQLDNGLTVLLQQDNTVPLISFNTWFRVGSKDENTGYTGLAHLFEHMMFKGAKRYSGDDFVRLLQENGGNFNAFTSYDYTGYLLNLPSSKLELAADLESDRMVNLKISDAMLKSEREVVKEERRFRYDNSVMGTLMEAIYAKTFLNNAYRWPVIGSMEDLDRVSVPVAMDFYRKFYSPNNAILAVVGDFQIPEAKKIIEKYYGDLDKQQVTRNAYPIEPEKTKESDFVINKDSQNDYIAMTYMIPQTGTDESYIFEIISRYIGEGNSSPLYKRLVYETQLATSASAGVAGLKEKDMFQILVSMRPEKDSVKKNLMINEVKKIIDGEIWKLQNKLISDQDLQKAKNNIVKDLVDSLKTYGGRARGLISNEILYGSYDRLFSDIPRYMRINPEDIKKAANQLLNKNQRTNIHLQPEQGKK